MGSKWQNVDAGPRQVKDANKAISALDWEGKTFTEVNGVAGGEEHRSAMTNMFGAVRPEVTALGEAIGQKYGYQVTKANVRAIIADFEAALAEAVKSRPVQDNRRSHAEEAERTAKVAAQEAKWQAQEDAAKALMAQITAKAPAGAKGLIYAEYDVDASDPMTDYFNSHTTRTVAIGFRFTSREDFRALAAAAAAFSETAEVEFSEHRDNYSMGGGNYLSDHGSDRSGTGWVIRSRTFPCGGYLRLTEDAIPDQPASGGNGFYDQRGSWIPQCDSAPSGPVTVRPSSLGRDGVVEIVFSGKPDESVRAGLKAHGFRWARTNGCWYGRDAAYAETLAASPVAS